MKTAAGVITNKGEQLGPELDDLLWPKSGRFKNVADEHNKCVREVVKRSRRYERMLHANPYGS
jgi:hypothetical protein